MKMLSTGRSANAKTRTRKRVSAKTTAAVNRGKSSRTQAPKTASAKSAREAHGSRSIKRAPQRRQGAAKTTTDHGEIRRWAEARGGTPATVKGTERSRQSAGLLRIDFPGFAGQQSLERVEWDEWFEKFDESKLAFLFQDRTADGKESRFFKLVRRKK